MAEEIKPVEIDDDTTRLLFEQLSSAEGALEEVTKANHRASMESGRGIRIAKKDFWSRVAEVTKIEVQGPIQYTAELGQDRKLRIFPAEDYRRLRKLFLGAIE